MATGSGLAAADMYTYVIVLHDRVAAGEAPEPQIAAPDGEVLHRFENQRVVRMTAPAARSLALHPEVRYVQRVQVAGEVPPLLHSVGGAASAIAANDWAPPTWASGDYVYDGEGNIIAIGTATGPASDGGTESYAYDSAGRLVSASIAHGATQSEQYTYDSFGNLVATTRTAGPSTSTPASLATNRLTAATYDAAGNVTANESGTTEYHYNSFNMLRAKTTSTSTALYVYTADDERVGVYENGEQRWMIRDLSGKVLREWRDAGLVWLWREDYVYRNGALAAAEREPAEGGTRHYHLDHLGTPRLITDAAGRKIALHDYFPFGVEKTDFRQEMLERGTKWPEDMKFTGHERDFTGGIASNNRNQLDYMHARYYAPVWGRFLSVDPVMEPEEYLREPQGWNRYAYAINNPLKNVDPDGKRTCVFIVSSGGDLFSRQGHAALYVETPRGTAGVSLGTTVDFSHGVQGFIDDYNAQGRTVTAYDMKVSPQNEEAIRSFINSDPAAGTDSNKNIQARMMLTENCATGVCNALAAGGVGTSTPGKRAAASFFGTERPFTLQNNLERGPLSVFVGQRVVFTPGKPASQPQQVPGPPKKIEEPKLCVFCSIQ